MNTSHRTQPQHRLLLSGMRDGLPICLGYLAVSFSLGIAARNAGLNGLQGFLLSLFNNASAGEYAAILVMDVGGSYGLIALMTLVANARYLLMSCALSQRFSPSTPFYHRFLLAHGITDELFGLSISRPGPVEPIYVYGAFGLAELGWCFGTMIGVIVGNVLPDSLISALSVALFGMFIAIIIPPAKQDRAVLLSVAVSFVASYGAAHLPKISQLSDGTRTILLTVMISAGAALLFPIKPANDDGDNR